MPKITGYWSGLPVNICMTKSVMYCSCNLLVPDKYRASDWLLDACQCVLLTCMLELAIKSTFSETQLAVPV